MNLYTKITKLIKKNNITIAELEKTLGFGNGSIKRWEKSSPSCEKILLVSDYFNVSLDYLLRDELDNNLTKSTISPNIDILDIYNNLTARQQLIVKGKLYEYEDLNNLKKTAKIKETMTPLKIVEHKKTPIIEEIIPIEKIILPVYSQRASAGIGKYMIDDDTFEEQEFDLDQRTQKADHAIIVDGNSMSPTIEDGDYIFIREQQKVEHNEIGVFVYEDNVYCKRLHIDYKKKQLTLLSDNENYPDVPIENIDNLRTIGKVIL